MESGIIMQAFDAQPDITRESSGDRNKTPGQTGEESLSQWRSPERDILSRQNISKDTISANLNEKAQEKPITSSSELRDPNASKKLSVSDIGINWQRDSKGNFVTRNSWGKLLTRDDNGQMVEYKHFIETKRMGARNQMALTSVLFCNPLMLLGLGGAFAFMDHFHKSNSEREYDRIKEKLEGKKTGKDLKGYSTSEVAKALVLVNDRRPIPVDGLIPAARAAKEAEELKKKGRQLSLENMRKRQFQAVRQSDQSNLTRKNLIKMKKRLEEQLELMRGNASLTDIAKIETQIEKLDRALKRFSALSL